MAGRSPQVGIARTEIIAVRLTPDELAAVDAARGAVERSAYVRTVLAMASRRSSK